ncbi:MAG: hypothetical protein ACPGN3_05570 [Opitutales bacterium]
MFPFEEKKKKVDTEALHSAFMRIPRMKVEVARYLLDLGFRDIFELEGRSPEIIHEDVKRHHPDLRPDSLQYLRMAVYVAENSDPDPKMCHPAVWAD